MAAPIPTSPFGQVNPPPVAPGLETGPTALVNLLNLVLKILIMVGGIWGLFNVIIAGYQFMIAAGDPKMIEKAGARLWQTLLGLLFIAGSFVLAAIFGQLLFGDPGAILNPKLFVPSELTLPPVQHPPGAGP